MDFRFTPEEQAFRAEVRSFLDEHLPQEEPQQEPQEEPRKELSHGLGQTPPGPEAIAAWNRALSEKGWIGFAWPKEVGGYGGGLMEQFILKEEMAARGAPPLGRDFMGLQWVGPAIIRHGTPRQQRRFLPDLLAGRSLWCTGYSEPDAGSDLAALKCRALRQGDEYVINGSKIWTTLAHQAKWIFMLVRTETDESVSRYRGISCLLVPMDTAGIEVRPIPNLTGYESFNQVFFNDVRVPLENRLGEEGQGWTVVVGALANERSGISEATEKVRHLDELVELARNTRQRGRPALEDPAVRRKLAAFQARISAMRLNGMRYLTRQLNGETPSSETSVNKLVRGQLEHEMSNFAMALLGSRAQLEGHWQSGSLAYHGTVIGGGTPNIQRNIIGERILGLPKD
jgi:alkylation response protein AidB-like acyl-CoA dehydrogenase